MIRQIWNKIFTADTPEDNAASMHISSVLTDASLEELRQSEDIEALDRERQRIELVYERLHHKKSNIHPERSPGYARFKAQGKVREGTSRLALENRHEIVTDRISALKALPPWHVRVGKSLRNGLNRFGRGIGAVILSVGGLVTFQEPLKDLIYQGNISRKVEETERLMNLSSPEINLPNVILYGQPAETRQSPYSVIVKFVNDELNENYDVTVMQSGGGALCLHRLDEAPSKGEMAVCFAPADLYYEGRKKGKFQNVEPAQDTGIDDCAQLAARRDVSVRIQEAGSVRDYLQNRLEEGETDQILVPNLKFASYEQLRILLGELLSDYNLEIVSFPQSQGELVQEFSKAGNGYEFAFYMESPLSIMDPGMSGRDNPLPENWGGDMRLFGLFNHTGTLGMARDINENGWGIVDYDSKDFRSLVEPTGLRYTLESFDYSKESRILPYSSRAEEKPRPGNEARSENSVSLICTRTLAFTADPDSYESSADAMQARAMRDQIARIPFLEAVTHGHENAPLAVHEGIGFSRSEQDPQVTVKKLQPQNPNL